MVEITYLALIGIALAAMFFGYGFGLFEGRSQGYRKRKAEEANDDTPQPESRTVAVDDPGLLRIKAENGTPALDLDGVRVNPNSLTPQERKRLIEMLNLMRPWLETRPEAGSAPVQPAMTGSSRDSASIQSPRASGAAARPQPGEERPAPPANSIVAQIDSILQARVATGPLAGRVIFLAQAPDGGVIVHVGVERYNGVEEVPDPEIKAAIRAAIAEWESKYTPGL